MSTLTPRQRLAAGFLGLRQKLEYLSALLDSFVVVQSEHVPTLGVDHLGRFYWNAAYVESLSGEELAGAIWHEAMHVLFDHPARYREIHAACDHTCWNFAADLAINTIAQDAHVKLPKNGLQPKLFGFPERKTTLEYLALLNAKVEEQLSKMGKGVAAGDCGSCAHGGDDKGSQKRDEDGKGGGGEASGGGADAEGEGLPVRTQAEMDAVRRSVAQAAREQASRNAGSVPGDLLRWAEDLLRPPKVRWQDLLAKVLRGRINVRRGMVDYSYGRMNRRQTWGAGDFILPAMVAPIPTVAVVGDTSGSMGNDELAVVVSEVGGICRALGTPIEFISADCQAHAAVKVSTAKAAARALVGGGGTDFTIGVEAFERLRPRPSLLVYITDGIGGAPAEAPKGYDIVWVLCGPGRQRPFAGAYGSGKQIDYGFFVEVDSSK